MSTKPPIFIELCAGTAALSLRLQGGPKAKPPVSRMGAKTGYADAILAVLGLYPGQGAESYLWCEPDDGVRGLLMAYPQPEVLRAAAKILRGWKDEEPRALWERLRAELKAGAAVEGAEGVAKFCMVTGCSMSGTYERFGGWFCPEGDAAVAMLSKRYIDRLVSENGRDAKGRPLAKTRGHPDVMAPRLEAMAERTYPPTFIARDGRAVTPEEVARIFTTFAWSYRRCEPESGYNAGVAEGMPESASHHGGGALTVADLALRISELPPFPPVTIVADGRVVTPEEVAAWAFLSNGAYRKGEIESGYDPTRSEERPATATGGRQPGLLEALPPRFEAMPPFPPVTITADARLISPSRLPEGVIVYADPPYLNTTGYKDDLPRAEVVRMARLWADTGATVCISEAEPIPELMADGWHAVEISATRKGATRTFTGQQKMAKKKQPAEWLTLSRPPSFVPRAPEVFIEAPIVEVVKPARVKVAAVIVEASDPEEDRQADLFG